MSPFEQMLIQIRAGETKQIADSKYDVPVTPREIVVLAAAQAHEQALAQIRKTK